VTGQREAAMAYFKSAKSRKRVGFPRKKGFLAVGANTAFGAGGVGEEMQANKVK